ncbi:MAG: glycoside hydrolase [Planctomycetes bacterium]|nr:glycoside hydrolase [Planctomycetota bacterium]
MQNPSPDGSSASLAQVWMVQDVPGYNSWPMIQAIGDRLVCAYSRGAAHDIGEVVRGVYTRTSTDGGRTWTAEVCVSNDPAFGEVTIGKGLDETGAMLLWVRCWSAHPHHDLYRTVDGVHFDRISTPGLSPIPMQITDIFAVPGVGLMSLWFAGDYRADCRNSWGVITSTDGGRVWKQRTIEAGLEKGDWPTEQSAAYLGKGRILVIARTERGGKCQFQITSTDGGATWTRTTTNIDDVCESTPSLIFDAQTGLVANYYYQRGRRQLKRRMVKADWIFDHPLAWPEPEVLAEGKEPRDYDAGNVNTTVIGNTHFAAYYTGSTTDTAVLVAATAAPGT